MKDILIDSAVRKIPDFPKKGILFYDITGLLINPEAFHYCLDKLTSFYKNEKIDAVAAIESRSFSSGKRASCREKHIPVLTTSNTVRLLSKYTLPIYKKASGYCCLTT